MKCMRLGTLCEFSKQAKTCGFKIVSRKPNFSDLTNVFVQIIVFPLNLVLRVSFSFLASEETELLWRSLNSTWITYETRHFSDCCWYVQSSLWIVFDRSTRYYWQKLIGCSHFLWHNKMKLLGMNAFLKAASIAKKSSSENDCTMFLLRDEEQLQLLPNLAVLKDFTVLHLVMNQWACDDLCKTSVQNPGSLSPLQCSEPLYQSIWLLLYDCCLLYFTAVCL